jgi:amidase
MARTVTDAAILLGVIAAIDESILWHTREQGKAQKDYTSFLVNALKGNVSELKKKPQGNNKYINAF